MGTGDRCKIFEVSDLLKALVAEVIKLTGQDQCHKGRESTVIKLLLYEVVNLPSAPYYIPMPSDKRLLAVCRELLRSPMDKRNLDEWAHFSGLGRRTLTRNFRKETGMSLSTWRQQARLLEAISLLAEGQPVTSVAYTVGYESPSAFTSIFRRYFGAPPKDFKLK
ncbi:MAG: AraC family transcriptional regulator [Pseudomonadota bacterium]